MSENKTEKSYQAQIKKQLDKEAEKHRIREYERTIKYHIMTTRFNNETAEENRIYRSKKHIENYCIYGTPVEVSRSIHPDAKMIVLEMNNDQNRIIGIGLLVNRRNINTYTVYKNPGYNRYCYLGKDRITREEMSEEEEITMKIFDKLCFEGTLHSKRGHGLRTFPTKILYRCLKLRNLENELVEMFKKRKQNKNTQ
jgi:hypothetical protein